MASSGPKGPQGDGSCATSSFLQEGQDAHWMRHPLGCRVEGYFNNRSGCIAAGYNFTSKLTSQAQCLSVMGCRDPFESHYNSKGKTACLACGGSWESRFRWTSGNWISGTTSPFVWKPNGIKLEAANKWVPSMSERKMEVSLQIPVMKMFAEKKKTQT